jgi:hypothetical protein
MMKRRHFLALVPAGVLAGCSGAGIFGDRRIFSDEFGYTESIETGSYAIYNSPVWLRPNTSWVIRVSVFTGTGPTEEVRADGLPPGVSFRPDTEQLGQYVFTKVGAVSSPENYDVLLTMTRGDQRYERYIRVNLRTAEADSPTPSPTPTATPSPSPTPSGRGFTLAVSPTGITDVPAGEQRVFTLTVTPQGGYAGTIALGASIIERPNDSVRLGALSSSSLVFAAGELTPKSVTQIVTSTSATPSSTTRLRFLATDSSLRQEVDATISYRASSGPSPTFNLTASNEVDSSPRFFGGSVGYEGNLILLAPQFGFDGTVALSLENVPDGWGAEFVTTSTVSLLESATRRVRLTMRGSFGVVTEWVLRIRASGGGVEKTLEVPVRML